MVLQAGWVRRSREEGDLHLWHQRVVGGHVGQTQAVRRPPVGDVGLQDLLCDTQQTQSEDAVFASGFQLSVSWVFFFKMH